MGKEKYQIISDSSCDLTLEMAEQLKVKIDLLMIKIIKKK